MKTLYLFLALLPAFAAQARAQRGEERPPRFSPQEFTKRQVAFIIKDAGLSPCEAACFFPLYHSMGKEKFELDRRIMKLMEQGKASGLRESRYADILAEADKLQVEKAKLEAGYHQKFRKVLPAKKVLLVIDADMKFNRQVLREMMHRRTRLPARGPKRR